MAHFKRNGYQFVFYNTLAKLIDGIEEAEAVKENNPLINILGYSNNKDMQMLRQHFIKEGFRINVLDLQLSMKALKEVLYGKLSIVLSPKMVMLAKALKDKYNVPYVCLHDIFDSSEIQEAYGKIFDALNISPCRELETLHNKAEELEEKAAGMLKNKKYVSSNPELNIIPLSSYLCKFGMEPLLLHVEEFYEDNKKHSDRILAYGKNPLVCYITDAGEILRVVNLEVLDLSFGRWRGLDADKIIDDMYINKLSELSGYDRTIEFLEMMLSRFNQRTEEGKADGLI